MSWVSVKEALPNDGDFVKVKIKILYESQREAMYVKKYFVIKGENVTKWVTHWQPSLKE